MKRPPGVWIAQFLVGMAGALMIIGTYRWSRLILDGVDSGMAINVSWLYIEGAIRLVLVALFAVTFWCISRARPAGRWLGVASLLAILAIAAWAAYLRSRGTPAFLEPTAEGAGAYVLTAVVAAAYLLLIHRLGFSRASRAYFNGIDTRDPGNKLEQPRGATR